MKGLSSDYQLTLPAMLKRPEALYGPKEIVTCTPDKSFHRYTYADFVRRAKKLAVAEAAVIAIPDERWGDRPIGVVVLREGEEVTEEELISLLAENHPKWSLPDAIEFVDEIPHAATGKALKMELREPYKNYQPAKG